MSTKLEQATIAIKTDDKATGKQLLTELLKTDPRNEQAWLWLSQVVDSDADRLKCLQNVLKINPNNEMAKRGLAVLQQEQVGQPQPAATLDEAPPLSGEAALKQIEAARARGLTPDLSEANLTQANLKGADLSEVNLRGANLSEANLSQANLRYANLIGADLSGTDLSRADLYETYLSRVKHNSQTIWPAGFTVPETQQPVASLKVETPLEVTKSPEGRQAMQNKQLPLIVKETLTGALFVGGGGIIVGALIWLLIFSGPGRWEETPSLEVFWWPSFGGVIGGAIIGALAGLVTYIMHWDKISQKEWIVFKGAIIGVLLGGGGGALCWLALLPGFARWGGGPPSAVFWWPLFSGVIIGGVVGWTIGYLRHS